MIGGGEGVPTHICIKGVLTDTGAAPSASIVETLFYRDAAADLPVNVPDCIHASLNADASRGVIVMRDVIAAGGRFCTALEAFTPDEAADGLDQLARLHVASQPGSVAFGFGWARSFLDQISKQPIIPHDALQALLDGPRGAARCLPCAMRGACKRDWRRLPQRCAAGRSAWFTATLMRAIFIAKQTAHWGWSTGRFCKRAAGRWTSPIISLPC